jgi:hypothetical protein
MDVFLLPVGPAPAGRDPKFQLYCEPLLEAASGDVPHANQVGTGPRPRSTFGRLRDKVRSFGSRLVSGFKQALAEGEAEERREEDGQVPEGGNRTSRFLKRKLAAAVAEQRLLWRLRDVHQARLHHPATISSARALDFVVAEFTSDFAKHRLWCVVDALVVVASAPLALVPGPNFLAYYFIFRSVGHFFSLRGAQKGMRREFWTATPSVPLTDLQDALHLDAAARAERIEAIGRSLGLARLEVFMRRVFRRTTKS